MIRKTRLLLIMAVLCVITLLPSICNADTPGVVPDSKEFESQMGAGNERNSSGNEESKSAKSVPPRLIQASKSTYPTEARKKGWEGKVILRIIVSEDGSVVSVVVDSSSGFEILDNAAVEAVKTWRFMPPQKNGEAVPCGLIIPIRFELDNDTSPSVEISEIQQKLNDLGFDSGEPDGTMNDRTKTAIMDFQRSKGLEPHGGLDQQTLEALGLGSSEEQPGKEQSGEGNGSGSESSN